MYPNTEGNDCCAKYLAFLLPKALDLDAVLWPGVMLIARNQLANHLCASKQKCGWSTHSGMPATKYIKSNPRHILLVIIVSNCLNKANTLIPAQVITRYP